MVLHVSADVKKIDELGKAYPWPRPERCPCCKSPRIWGHGYVHRYFEGFIRPLWIKRYRCPDCHTVCTLRPDLFYMRFRYPLWIILHSLTARILYHRFVTCVPRQNQQYWYKGLIFQASGIRNVLSPDLLTLRDIISRNTIPASHSFKCAVLRL